MMRTIIINLILGLFLKGTVGAVDGYWVERAQMPEPRTGHAAVVAEGTVYITGGRTTGPAMNATRQQLWAYDPAANQWNTGLPDMPEPREAHVAVALGDTIWVFGGRNHNDLIPEVDFWVVGSNQWQSAGTMSTPREGMGVVAQSGSIYLIGGKASHSMWAPPVTRVDRFDPQTRQWTVSDTLNQARVGFAWAAQGDTIICAGGRFVDPLTSVEQRIDAEAWQSVVPLTNPRSDGSAVFFRGDFVLLGGIGSEGQADDNQYYDGINWHTFESNLLPRFGETGVVAGDAIYVMGGRNGNQLLRSTEQFIPTTGLASVPFTPEKSGLIEAFPNPFNGSVRLTFSLPPGVTGVQNLSIYNTLGQIVYRQNLQLTPDNPAILLEGTGLGSSGVYVAVLRYMTRSHSSRYISQKLTYLK